MAKRKKPILTKGSKRLPSLRNSLKRKTGEKSFAEKWSEFKAEEKALAEAKAQRSLVR